MERGPGIARAASPPRSSCCLEPEAVTRGRTCLRLTTRRDLAEARALYARLGYQEAPPFNDALFTDHWLEKRF